MLGNKIKKHEYFLDIFKGTCELNNYNQVESQMKYEGSLRKNLVDSTLEELKTNNETGKFYTYGIVFNEEETFNGLTLMQGNINAYRLSELINLNVKILYNAGLDNAIVHTSNKEIIDNLEAVDLETKEENVKKENYDKIDAFEIEVEGLVVAHGGYNEDFAYMTCYYDAIEDLIDYDENSSLDAYIMPKEKECLDDAFVIATNLKDAGFRVDVDYELNKQELAADFLITFDSKDISNYQVHFKDLKTNEEKEVMIDNIVEELSFF